MDPQMTGTTIKVETQSKILALPLATNYTKVSSIANTRVHLCLNLGSAYVLKVYHEL